MYKFTFYLPIQDNDGSSLLDLIKRTEQALAYEFGCYTKLGHIYGLWVMEDGERVNDISMAYTLTLSIELKPALVRILQAFKRETTQECIYLDYSPVTLELI